MSSAHRKLGPGSGPFRADQIREGDPYELSNGHPILRMPTGQRGGRANLTGGSVLETDPAVKAAGVDIGFSDNPGHLRAPDVSVGDIPNEPGWASKAPPLAVEYADRGQNEDDLQAKIREMLDAGTRYVWVVRLVGPRRVEIHEKGKAMRRAHAGEELTAPGILQNPVPVDALYDPVRRMDRPSGRGDEPFRSLRRHSAGQTALATPQGLKRARRAPAADHPRPAAFFTPARLFGAAARAFGAALRALGDATRTSLPSKATAKANTGVAPAALNSAP